ncbi:hypothetical protein BJX70DRAFT_383744 [Aspergillus crustosus]
MEGKMLPLGLQLGLQLRYLRPVLASVFRKRWIMTRGPKGHLYLPTNTDFIERTVCLLRLSGHGALSLQTSRCQMPLIYRVEHLSQRRIRLLVLPPLRTFTMKARSTAVTVKTALTTGRSTFFLKLAMTNGMRSWIRIISRGLIGTLKVSLVEVFFPISSQSSSNTALI